MKTTRLGPTSILLCAIGLAAAQVPSGRIVVHADRPGPKISPTFYGLMTEEINHSYDGGLYGELVRNRSFKDSPEMAHWKLVPDEHPGTDISLDSSGLTLNIGPSSQIKAGLVNDGYWGIPIRPNTTYKARITARCLLANAPATLRVTLQSSSGLESFASATLMLTTRMETHVVTLRTSHAPTTMDARFVVAADKSCRFETLSLFGPTYRNRANGNRIDLMQKLGELNPSFLRLPGGNYLEGNTIPERFEWKDTLGDPAKRPGHQGPWGYRSSDGLGFLEFLEWCEDLHMQPVLAVYAGYSLRQRFVKPGPDLVPFVQDALDEIEYVTGSTKTKWGEQRARDGHPKPFPLTYVEIGNEDGFDRTRSYDGRYAQFGDAIKSKYPHLKLIATARISSRTPDVYDDHYYRTANAMERDAAHYDGADRNGPKIFVGEWASTEGSPTPNMQAALGDAAWLTGLERNSDLVVMESYAPLLVNVNPGASQWGTNLVGYDALTSFGSPSFYVQSMFAKNTGDEVVPAEVQLKPTPQYLTRPPHGAIGVGTWRTRAEYKDIEVTHDGKTLLTSSAANPNWSFPSGAWSLERGVLRQTSDAENCRAIVGDPSWTDYTLRLKARKISGAEGFLVLFHVNGQDDLWWNVGGWGNTRTALEKHENGGGEQLRRARPMKVETGRWYDIRIEVSGLQVKCFLDDKLVTAVDDTSTPPTDPIYVAASRVTKSGQLILKIVNVSPSAQSLTLDIQGIALADTAQGWQLAGQPLDVNSIESPTKIAPKKITLNGIHAESTQTFAPHSVTVLRFNKANRQG